MATNTKIVQTPAVALYTSLASVASSMTVTPYPVDLDGVKLTMSDFGATGLCTVDPKVSGFEEIVSFTGITDNGNNTATLTGLARDLQSKYPYTASGSGKQHGASAVVVFSNNPQVMAKYPARDNDETITGQWTFTVFPITPSNSPSSTTVLGVTKVSVAPVLSTNPIAVGDNDPRVPTQSENDALVGTSGTPSSTNPFVTRSSVKFGGTGADGALTATSGVTNVDCAGAQFVVKNYASISITGTGAVKFINPHANGTTIIVKVQGSVTLTSSATPMLDASGMGAAGGTPGSVSTTGSLTSNGTTGNTGIGLGDFSTNPGVGGAATTGADGSPPTTFVVRSLTYNASFTGVKYGQILWVAPGGGGGSAYNNSGSTHALTGGNGGLGGGCLVIECAGAWNFTTANGISVAGIAGTNASATGGTNFGAGGGGGGGGGFFLALYNILTANTGTIAVAAGAVGTNSAGGTGNFGPGGSGCGALTVAGTSIVAFNAEFA